MTIILVPQLVYTIKERVLLVSSRASLFWSLHSIKGSVGAIWYIIDILNLQLRREQDWFGHLSFLTFHVRIIFFLFQFTKSLFAYDGFMLLGMFGPGLRSGLFVLPIGLRYILLCTLYPNRLNFILIFYFSSILTSFFSLSKKWRIEVWTCGARMLVSDVFRHSFTALAYPLLLQCSSFSLVQSRLFLLGLLISLNIIIATI